MEELSEVVSVEFSAVVVSIDVVLVFPAVVVTVVVVLALLV